ncbi:VCBS repeat-containing protein [Streptomyces sp. NPDC006923]|uniref:VCBS repeat-containing protein n=1 Tax=Streptomyces sp. NPDC006923 TaxID=3155355 RepID=UPI0033C87C25
MTTNIRALACLLSFTALLLAGCAAGTGAVTGRGPEAAEAKNGDTAPRSGRAGAPRRPVPRGGGSRIPDDFNGDGHRDLVLNDLVRAPGDRQGEDAGIGIVYGTSAARGLDPAVRQTLSAATRGAEAGGGAPAAFEAEAACDLDQDGFGDLIIATERPYAGHQGPPGSRRILFGGPGGLAGEALVPHASAGARLGGEWPGRPVCRSVESGGEDLTAGAGLRLPPAPLLPRGLAGESGDGTGVTVTELLRSADFNGDGRPDLVTRTHRGEQTDLIALYDPGVAGDRPVITFSTSVFLG